MSFAILHCKSKDCAKQSFISILCSHLFEFPIRSEDDYSEEEDEEEDDEEEEEYDGEIPQPELEPRSRRCLVGDVGVCVIPGDCDEEEENEEDEEGGDMCGEDSDSDGSVLYKEESSDEDEEDEPPLSRNMHSNNFLHEFALICATLHLTAC